MTTKKSNKGQIYLYILLIVAGLVIACTSIVSNDYLKLVIVMVSLGAGLFGIMKGLGSSGSTDEETAADK